MEENNQIRKQSLSIRIAKIILVLVVLSIIISLISLPLAKYRLTKNAGDSARVAKFGAISIIEEGPPAAQVDATTGKIKLKPDGNNIQWSVKVSFPATEVRTRVSVIVDSTGWIYESGKYVIKNADNKVLAEWTPAGTWTVSGAGNQRVFTTELQPREGLEEITFMDKITNHMTVLDAKPTGSYTLKFSAKAEQID